MCEDNQKSKKKKWEKSDIISVLNLLLLIVGGVLGYFYIHKPLVDIQSKRSDVENTIDITQLISDIQPKFNFKRLEGTVAEFLKPDYDPQSKTLTLEPTLINIGKYRVSIINNPKLIFSKSPLTDKKTTNVDLLPERDYSIQTSALIGGGIDAGDTCTGRVKIQFTEIPTGKIYGHITLTATTIPQVKEAAKNLLIGILEPNDVEALTLRNASLFFDFDVQ